MEVSEEPVGLQEPFTEAVTGELETEGTVSGTEINGTSESTGMEDSIGAAETEVITEPVENPDGAETEENVGSPEREDHLEPVTEAELETDPETDTAIESEMDTETESETETEPESETEKEGKYKVNITSGEELGVTLNHANGCYDAGETVTFSTNLPEGCLTAVGAKPHSILLALSLPQIDHAWLSDFSQGLYDCCDQFGVSLIGGDTTQSPHLTITVTALGWIEQGQAVQRSGAKPGDYICVSGTVGDAAYGLAHLGHPLQQRLDYPTPRCELGLALKGLASSMIDVSDGLAQDLGHILKASQVGASIELNDLPLSETLRYLQHEQRYQYALAGGDDYELCFTISPEHYVKLKQRNLTTNYRKIGVVQSKLGLEFTQNGLAYSLDFHGYQHFA